MKTRFGLFCHESEVQPVLTNRLPPQGENEREMSLNGDLHIEKRREANQTLWVFSSGPSK